MMTTLDWIVTGTFLTIAYLIGLYVYRIFLHPLAKFPGPKLAAASRWYEFYYDVVLEGQYTFHLQKLHQQYGKWPGPILRVAPDELHVNDPDFFDRLYVESGRLDRFDWANRRFGSGGSVFTAGPDALHRARRSILSPFFSKRRIQDFEYVVREGVEHLLHNVAKYKDSGNPVAIDRAYMALSGDVIMEYCFGQNYNHLDRPDFNETLHDSLMAASRAGHMACQFPLIPKVMMALPRSLLVKLEPLYSLMFDLQVNLRRQIQAMKASIKAGEKSEGRPNVFTAIIQANSPASEKTDTRLQDEAQVLVGAGVTTTGWALSVATFHILNNPHILKRLRAELEHAMPNASAALEWAQLERLPYLTGCLKEAIRLAYGITGRTPRLAPGVIQYKEWTIPPRTAVGMTLVDINHDESIFPNSTAFQPERWLDNPRCANGEKLEKYFVGFMKGSRVCLGMNLAWAELYLTLAGVFRNLELELYETDETDVLLAHDFMIPSPKLDSKGVRVRVKSSLI